MLVVGYERVKTFQKKVKHPEAPKVFKRWLRLVEEACWEKWSDVKQTFNSADQVTTKEGQKETVFNVGGNKYRIIAAINYQPPILVIRYVFTHAQYDKWEG